MSSFPTLRITADSLTPVGAFAVAQAEYLHPDPSVVQRLDALCRDKNIGIVAHFYMDAELQGVLSAMSWEQVVVADSLKMADASVKMVEAGVSAVIVLGVDFMSENARAVLDAAGGQSIPVYRVAAEEIGCSLAESAEGEAYATWLDRAAQTDDALHVVYINTSLETKAEAHHKVPTITCTSSNVVQTILQAASQVPELSVYYGPDTYMGNNLVTLFTQYATLTDEQIRAIHPAHDRASIQAILDRMVVFQQGACVVHHMFGAEVTERVRTEHADAYHTAHLEVPGEMFALAADAARVDRGVVGSTSNILGFIVGKVAEAVKNTESDELSFVLGTEAGMVTSIVKAVQAELRRANDHQVSVEIVFPVASEAVAEVPGSELGIIPGIAAGEGCSIAGGCATCPYMKMNSLDRLLHVLDSIGVTDLTAYRPRQYTDTIGGRTAADLGSQPILHMRHFQTTGKLPQSLVDDIRNR